MPPWRPACRRDLLAHEGARGDRVAEPARPAALPAWPGRSSPGSRTSSRVARSNAVGVEAVLAPLCDAPEPAVVPHRPEVRDLAAERAGDRLEQVRRGLVEAACAGDRARDAVLRLSRAESRSRWLAQAGDEHRHGAADEEHGRSRRSGGRCRTRRCQPRRAAPRPRAASDGDEQRLASRRAGRRDQRPDEQQLDEQRDGVDREVDDDDHRHGGQRQREALAYSRQSPP